MKLKISFSHDYSRWSNPGLAYTIDKLLKIKNVNNPVAIKDQSTANKLAVLGYEAKVGSEVLMKDAYNACKNNLASREVGIDLFTYLSEDSKDMAFIESSKQGYYYPAELIVDAPDKVKPLISKTWMNKLISILNTVKPIVNVTVALIHDKEANSYSIRVSHVLGLYFMLTLNSDNSVQLTNNKDVVPKPFIKSASSKSEATKLFWSEAKKLINTLLT